jgi:hypothetical protein
MQRTRLNSLANAVGDRWIIFLSNPWRRVSLQAISFLLGLFVGQAVSTISGQASQWDIVAAAFLVLFTEVVNRFTYRRASARARLVQESLNLLKIGITYSLFLEAFKLGS